MGGLFLLPGASQRPTPLPVLPKAIPDGKGVFLYFSDTLPPLTGLTAFDTKIWRKKFFRTSPLYENQFHLKNEIFPRYECHFAVRVVRMVRPMKIKTFFPYHLV
jgi:hypothetical protein